MIESKIQTKFAQYLLQTRKYFYYELKRASCGRFYYRDIAEHQINGLLSAQEHGLVWKLSDADPRQKPFDGFSAPPMNAYVCIAFDTVVYAIPIQTLLAERDEFQQKSLRYHRARELAQYIVEL